jgi:uncharacterized damage-inducible protein DinB
MQKLTLPCTRGAREKGGSMTGLDWLRALLEYNDWADRRLLECARPLSDEQLDRKFDMGPGSLRRTLLHIWAGEDVWRQRCAGHVETPWPREDENVSVAELASRFEGTWGERDRFLGAVKDADVGRVQKYRDSKGSMFQAPLREMLMQLCWHATHHRAQAVNMLRRVGGEAPELDWMMRIRKAAGG